jgi:Pyruvate/2-oxoacid:ferredoxin oxidoreductase delta subunit
MDAVPSERLRPVLFCNCAYDGVTPAATRQRVFAALARASRPVAAIGDLCAAAAGRAALPAGVAEARALTVVACHPRAVRWLLHAAGARVQPAALEVVDLRAETAEGACARLGVAAAADEAAAPGPAAPGRDGDWVPWFPVIDFDRCRNCRQCLNFCLFGVYGSAADGRVRVQEPAACKTHCPACARICPEAAIIFPKAGEAPINGEEIRDEEAVRAAVRVNVKQILGSDVYAALAQRQARARQRRLAEEERLRAAAEEKPC